nr:unnamed protein product [Callosobruchus analis]
MTATYSTPRKTIRWYKKVMLYLLDVAVWNVREATAQPVRVENGHWPEKIPAQSESSKKFCYKKCRLCTRKKQRKEASFCCKGCPEKPPLCPGCFEEWHQPVEK